MANLFFSDDEGEGDEKKNEGEGETEEKIGEGKKGRPTKKIPGKEEKKARAEKQTLEELFQEIDGAVLNPIAKFFTLKRQKRTEEQSEAGTTTGGGIRTLFRSATTGAKKVSETKDVENEMLLSEFLKKDPDVEALRCDIYSKRIESNFFLFFVSFLLCSFFSLFFW